MRNIVILFLITIIFSYFCIPISCKPGGINLFVGVIAIDEIVEMSTSVVIEVSSDSGGYITCGVANGLDFDRKIILINRVKGNGEVLWTKTFDGGGDYDHGCAYIRESSDNLGFLVFGTMTETDYSGYGALFMKLSHSGSVVWKFLYSPPDHILYVRRGEEVDDQGIVLVGQFFQQSNEFGQGLVMKFDHFGTLLWSRIFGTNETNLNSIQKFDDGILVGGYETKIGSGSPRIFFAKLSSEGNIEWSRTVYDSTDDDSYIYGTRALSFGDDNEIYVLGYRSRHHILNYSGYISKFDRTGGLLWIRSFEEIIFMTAVPNHDGNIIGLGGLRKDINGSTVISAVAAEIDSGNGTLINVKSFVSSGMEGMQYFTYSKPLFPYDDERFDGRYMILMNSYDDLLYQVMEVNSSQSSDPEDGFMFYKLGMKTYPLENVTENTNVTWLTSYSTVDPTWELYDGEVIQTIPQLLTDTGKLFAKGMMYYTVCNENYYDSTFALDCDVTTCNGVFSNETSEVCEGRGVCVGYDQCIITELFGILRGIRNFEITLYSSSSTESGGIISCGTAYHASGSDYGMFIHKSDEKGNTRWLKGLKFGGTTDICKAITQIGDTGIVFSGKANEKLMVMKLSDNGLSDLWAVGLPNDGSPSSARGLTVGGIGEILVVGEYIEAGEFEGDEGQQGVFMKIHPDGKVLFQRHINMGEDCFFNGVEALANDDEYVYVGCRRKITGECNPIIGKTDKGGDAIWTIQLESSWDSELFSVKETLDRKYLIAGGHSFGRTLMGDLQCPLMVKVNSSSGEIVWAKFLNISGYINVFSVETIFYTSSKNIGEEKGYLFVGFIMSWGGKLDFVEILLSPDGTAVSVRFGNPNFNRGGTHSVLHSITKDTFHDGRFIVSGYSGDMGYYSRLDVNASNCNLYNTSEGLEYIFDFLEEFSYELVYLEYEFEDFDNIEEEAFVPSYEDVNIPSSYLQVNQSCWSCVGIRNDMPPEMLCNGKGLCNNEFECVCQTEYLGEECDVPGFCFNISRNITDRVCSGHGDCVDLDVCQCNDQYFGDKCEMTYCYSLYNSVGEYESLNNQFVNRVNSTDLNITCSGHGTCNFDFGNCSCLFVEDSLYWDVGCHRFECFDFINNDTHRVCSGNGRCIDRDVCQCNDQYSGAMCEFFSCFGILMNDSSGIVCSGHGDCISHDNCSCQANYSSISLNDDGCDQWKCDGQWRDNLILACTGHGDCVSHDNCSCFTGYKDSFCGAWSCWDVSSMDIDNVCGGHGNCLDLDECFCRSGYGSSFANGPCTEWYCGQYMNSENETVCNARGECIESHNCECWDSFEGFECETWSCFFTPHDSPLTCSGNGDCLSPDNCTCKVGFEGDNCEINLWYYMVLIPSLSAVGLCLLCCFLMILCCIYCFILFLVFIFFLSLCGLSAVVTRQRVGMKRFSRLRNFELLLKEQELEDDTSIAHLRVNKTLFQIPFDEIKVERILGEGGSQSVVFKAIWKTQEVAFKCFKTRNICGNQESYEEFEKEVEILSSVSHPSIVRFFGATMKNPRVGIVMEYCKHGDLDVFLSGFQEKYGLQFPLKEKYRILHEQTSACAYLHSRNIIHRDLKLENVLLDSQLCSKLMDFGLSKIVDRMSQQKTKKIGTNIYMAPELVVGDGIYDEKCDVFSFGIMIFIIFTENRHPYGKKQNVEMKVANDADFRPNLEELENVLPEEMGWITDVVEKCWDADTEERPGFDILAKKFKENRSENEDLLFSSKKGALGASQVSKKSTQKVDRVSELLRSNRDSLQILHEETKRALKEGGVDGVHDEEEQDCLECHILKEKFKRFCEANGFDFDEIFSSEVQVPKKKVLFDRKTSNNNKEIITREEKEIESSSSDEGDDEEEDKEMEKENDFSDDEFDTSTSDSD